MRTRSSLRIGNVVWTCPDAITQLQFHFQVRTVSCLVQIYLGYVSRLFDIMWFDMSSFTFTTVSVYDRESLFWEFKSQFMPRSWPGSMLWRKWVFLIIRLCCHKRPTSIFLYFSEIAVDDSNKDPFFWVLKANEPSGSGWSEWDYQTLTKTILLCTLICPLRSRAR